MSFAAALALLALAPPSNPRVEAGLAPRQIPPGRWVADRDDGQCAVLRRTTDEPARTIALQLGPGSGLVRVLVFDAGWRRAAVRNRRRVELGFGGESVSSPKWVSGIESAGEYGFAFDMIDAALLDRLAESEVLTVRERGSSLLELALPSARTAVQALRECEEAALRTWGVDVAARARLKRQARPVEPLFRLFSYLDYPATALAKRVSGRVTVRLVIGKDGRVATCAVAESAGDPLLDRHTCTLLAKRARFEPALGPDGRPAEGTSVARVTWAVPRH